MERENIDEIEYGTQEHALEDTTKEEIGCLPSITNLNPMFNSETYVSFVGLFNSLCY